MQATTESKPKYSIDHSETKYKSRYDRILNILFYSKEIPSDLYLHMNMSYANFRKTISILHKRQLIKRIIKDGSAGYVLTRQGKLLTIKLEYMKYRDCLEDDPHQYDPAHRSRKFQFAYLYALFDRIGIPYERFNKPPLDKVDVFGNQINFYTATDIKRMLGMGATSFKGSRLLGFLIGLGKIFTVYRTNQGMKTFTGVEKLIPIFLLRYFPVCVNTAILICDNSRAVADISGQIIRNIRNKPKGGVNMADYKYFYVLPSDDSFLSCLRDVYVNHTEEEQNIIRQYAIETSEEDNEGRYRFKSGTGFLKGCPVLVCAGKYNLEPLKRFLLSARIDEQFSYILCEERDYEELKAIASDYPVSVVAM